MPNPQCVVAIISPDRNVLDEVAAALDGRVDLETVWTLADYPDPAALSQIDKANGGCVIFLDFRDQIRAQAVAAELDTAHPKAVTIAINMSTDPQDLFRLMQLGIREVVKLPVATGEVLHAFARAKRKLHPAGSKDEGGSLYAFLPAKPGVGSTTLAVHCAAAAARVSNQPTLLLDFDFRLGMTSFLLKLNGDYSVLDAIGSQAHLGGDLWDRMVTRRGPLEILGSAPVDLSAGDPEAGATQLVDLARQSYSMVCVDLPGEMRDYELDTLHRAKECFLVTTPDIGSLHMAKRKAELIHSLGLQHKVTVIRNRVEGKGSMSIADMEEILRLPVRLSVSSAERQITEAVQAGQALDGRSSLAPQIEAIARRMVPGTAVGGASKSRKFIDMFSVSRVRDRVSWNW